MMDISDYDSEKDFKRSIKALQESAYSVNQPREGELATLVELPPYVNLTREFFDFKDELQYLFKDLVFDFNQNSGTNKKVKPSFDKNGKLKDLESFSNEMVRKMEDYALAVIARKKASAINILILEIDLAAYLWEVISNRTECFLISQKDGEIVQAAIKIKKTKEIIDLSDAVKRLTREGIHSFTEIIEKIG